MVWTYGLHDNPNKCQSFSHENRKSDYPPAKYRTPDNKMSLCEACKRKWERNNWPNKCVVITKEEWKKKGGA